MVMEACIKTPMEAFGGFGSGDQDRNRRFEQVIGDSPALEAVFEQVECVAPTDSTALIQGETGTGKELIARAIHNVSARAGRSFVKLNCAAIPFDLLESELFGHEKGAFTGAIAAGTGVRAPGQYSNSASGRSARGCDAPRFV